MQCASRVVRQWGRLVRRDAGGAAGGPARLPPPRPWEPSTLGLVPTIPWIMHMHFGTADSIVPCHLDDSRQFSSEAQLQRPSIPDYCQPLQPLKLIGLPGGRLEVTLDLSSPSSAPDQQGPPSNFLSRRGRRSGYQQRRRRQRRRDAGGLPRVLASCLPPAPPPDAPTLSDELGILTTDNVCQHLLRIQYAVRGNIHRRAKEMEKELKKGKKFSFDRIIRAGVGDSQALGQMSCMFLRNVVAFGVNPKLMDEIEVKQDVRDRVKLLLSKCHANSAGAITPALGLTVIRQHAVDYLRRRDGIEAKLNDIFLGAGASDVLKTVLLLFRHKIGGLRRTGVMLPMPQYPLFSGLLSEMGQVRLDYQLDEDRGWAVDIQSLKKAYDEGKEHCNPRVLVMINPGNPTGHVLSKDNIAEVVKFAYEHKLFILSDEVYQQNIIKKKFFSVKKVMHMLGEPYSRLPMASVMSLSKGWSGEVGLRGSMCELLNVPPRVRKGAYDVRELMQCPSVPGQFAMDCVFAPPLPGEASYEEFAEYLDHKQEFFRKRAAIAETVFNSIPGYSCAPIDGAVFAYPRFELPERARQKARSLKMEPDEFYCLEMVTKIGVLVVPGSGFGQKPGTFHYRTTIINLEADFKFMMDNIKSFHENFLKEYS